MPKDAAVEEFARLVRALKARDGRSYEALGRRLSVSASTLHRYCSGATVPEEFAVVERLALLCGADEEERRALETAWTRADATRRPPAPEPGAADGAAGDATSGAEPGPDPEPAPEPAPPAPNPPPERRRRRWGRVGVIAGALASVAAVTLGAVLLPGTARKGTATPQAKASATATATATATKSQSPPAPTPLPLTWTVASDLWQNGCGHTYLVDRTPPPPPEPADARRWAAARGAVDGGETLVRVSVQGKGAAAVVLQALHVRVVDRGTPPSWAAYRMDGGCGGAVTPRRFEVDLDRPRPVARSLDGYDASGQEGRTLPAVSFPYAVSVTDPEELLVSARTAGCDCRWYLELEWSSEGRRGTVRIGDESGAPFRTSGAAGRPSYTYDSTRRTWITDPESGQAG
ncbi:helix-turn-helix transcriptional regulator [Streptomyces sp. NPDC048659]|uniref:helix-turn-helix domain-containing protein n=1 Tax=Streptomyces sp. NPDC048659 TaxID=3155489 RepID=UPI00344632DF